MSARLDAYSDSPDAGRQPFCDCGNAKSRDADACDRCTYLDGNREPAQVIDSLRGTDGLSIPEISAITGMSYRSLQRSLKRLLAIGRVRRYWQEGDYASAKRDVFGTACTVQAVCGHRWVYALDGKTESEWRAA